ncbi:MAG: hypothetical protein ACOYOS_24500 [Syntrophales bacterium]
MKNNFPQLLSKLRRKASLTNVQLSELAPVSRSLIGGLQSGKRVAGEYQAKKLGIALGLEGAELDAFIFSGINRCSEKVLQDSQPYPAELLNLLARQLKLAGVSPDKISNCVVIEDASLCNAAIYLIDGTQAIIETTLVKTS